MKRCLKVVVVVSVVAALPILLTQVTSAKYLGNPSFLGVGRVSILRTVAAKRC